LILGAELFQLFLPFQHQHGLVVGILGCLQPAFHVLMEKAPLAALGAELSGVEATGHQHHRDLVVSTPPSGSFSEAGTTSPCNRQVFLQLYRVITWMPSSSVIRATLCRCGGRIGFLTSALTASP
jgi:hypothetical protein